MNRDAYLKSWVARSLAILSVVAPLAGLVGCSTSPVVRVAEPVGPAPSSASFFDEGRLVVYTDVGHPHRDTFDEGYVSWEPGTRAPYTIYDRDGRVCQQVWNRGADASPETVTLPKGDYFVRARGLDGRLVDVTVRIERGKTTEVFLDRSWTPPIEGATRDSVVRANDGTAVGWRATAIGGGPSD